MAKILSNAGIVTGLPVEAKHVSQSVNALTAAEAYDINISGSLIVNTLTYPYVDGTADQSLLTDGGGNITIRTLETVPTASFVTSSGVYGPYGSDSIQTASYSITSSYALFAKLASSSLFSINSQNANTATSASYALTASYALNAGSGGGGGSGSFATSASFALTASYIEMANAYRQNISESVATITHNRDSEDVLVAVYKSIGAANPELIIPSSVTLTDTNTAVVVFSNIVEGYVIVTDGKGVANAAESASYALTASYALNGGGGGSGISSSYALTSSYAVTSSYSTGNAFDYTSIYVNTDLAVEKDRVYVFVSSTPKTITLPLSPSNGDSILISNRSGIATNIVARNGELIMGDAQDMQLDSPPASFKLTYASGAQGWVITGASSSGGSGSFNISASYALTASYALNAGGGGSSNAYISSSTTGNQIIFNRSSGGIIITPIISSSHSSTSISSSYALTASHLLGFIQSASYALTSSYAVSSSHAEFADSSSYATLASTASLATTTITSSYALTASYLEGLVESSSYALRAETVRTVTYPARNDDNAIILQGDPVYVVEVNNGIYDIRRAEALDPNKMPAVGVAATTAALGASVDMLLIGEIKNINTFGATPGRNIYVDSNGGYSQLKPTAPSLIQPIGIIAEASATAGVLLINGPMADMSSGSASVPTASYVSSSNVDGPYGLDSILTSSYALTASYLISGVSNNSYREAVSGNTTYTITHNLNENYPIVQSYEQSSLSQEIPLSIVSTGVNTLSITFVNNFDGTIVVIK